jgi:hypothetical protein
MVFFNSQVFERWSRRLFRWLPVGIGIGRRNRLLCRRDLVGRRRRQVRVQFFFSARPFLRLPFGIGRGRGGLLERARKAACAIVFYPSDPGVGRGQMVLGQVLFLPIG